MFSTAAFQLRRAGDFGASLYYFEQLESTNAVAEQLAREDCPEGTVVLANEQTGGKGRKGNAWFSPADVNLYFSLVVRPDSSNLKFLPYMISLAVHRALSHIGIKADLKWPNDVIVEGRKLCGILIQTALEDQKLQFAVIGCGINVNVSEFPTELRDVATSVYLEQGREEPREQLLASVLLEFERLYGKISETEWPDFCEELERASTFLRDCEVKVQQEHGPMEGITAGLDAFGGLVIRTESGEKTVYAGEVMACRKKQRP